MNILVFFAGLIFSSYLPGVSNGSAELFFAIIAVIVFKISKKIRYLEAIILFLSSLQVAAQLINEFVGTTKGGVFWIPVVIVTGIFLLINLEEIQDNCDEFGKLDILWVFLLPLYGIINLAGWIRSIYWMSKRRHSRYYSRYTDSYSQKTEHKQEEYTWHQSSSEQNSYNKQNDEEAERARQKERADRIREEWRHRQSRCVFFTNCHDRETLNKQYRKLVKQMHPDNGGNTEEFKQMSNEYDRLKAAM